MLREEIVEGARLFNLRKYFEAHEVFEEIWGLGNPKEREAVLGLVKASVGLHHLSRGNVRGARTELGSSVDLLEGKEGVLLGVGLAKLRESLESILARMEVLGADEGIEWPTLEISEEFERGG